MEKMMQSFDNKNNFTFVLGYKRDFANELIPFTGPERYDVVIKRLEEIKSHIHFNGDKLQLERTARNNSEVNITQGTKTFLRLTEKKWQREIFELALMGSKYLNKAINFIKHLPLRESLDEYLEVCQFPQVENIRIQKEKPDILSDGTPNIQHKIVYEGVNPVLYLPQITFLPFPKTVTLTYLELARNLIDKEAAEAMTEICQKQIAS